MSKQLIFKMLKFFNMHLLCKGVVVNCWAWLDCTVGQDCVQNCIFIMLECCVGHSGGISGAMFIQNHNKEIHDAQMTF